MKTTLKDCPSVHQVLLELNGNMLLHEDYIKYIINSELTKIRANIRKGKLSKTKRELLSHIASQVLLQSASKLVNVINGTGIVLHTGFGRAPFRGKQLKDLADCLDGYRGNLFSWTNGGNRWLFQDS